MNAAARSLLAAVALGALLAAFCVCVGAFVVERDAAPGAAPSAASSPAAIPPPAHSPFGRTGVLPNALWRHLPRAAGEERAPTVNVVIVNRVVVARPAVPRLPIVICGTGRC